MKIKEPVISRWMSGKAKPSSKSLQKLTCALNVPVSYLLGEPVPVIIQNYGIIGNNNSNNEINQLSQNIELLKAKVKTLELEIELKI